LNGRKGKVALSLGLAVNGIGLRAVIADSQANLPKARHASLFTPHSSRRRSGIAQTALENSCAQELAY